MKVGDERERKTKCKKERKTNMSPVAAAGVGRGIYCVGF